MAYEPSIPRQPVIQMQFSQISLVKMNLPAPYPIEQLVGIRAIDSTGNLINPRQIQVDSGKVDFAKPGLYYVPISAWDNAGNQAIAQIKVRILDIPQAQQILPIIRISSQDVYIKRGTTTRPNWSNLTQINAVDRDGNDITGSVTLKVGRINFNQLGTYVVLVKAIDRYGSISLSAIRVHIVDQEPMVSMTNQLPMPNYDPNANAQNTSATPNSNMDPYSSMSMPNTNKSNQTAQAVRSSKDNIFLISGVVAVIAFLIFEGIYMFG